MWSLHLHFHWRENKHVSGLLTCSFTKFWREAVLTGEAEAQLLGAGVLVLHAAQQRLHLDDEQIGAVLPSLGHRAEVLHP